MIELPDSELRRVARQLNLPGFGGEQQRRLYNAHVLIVGAGGLGCPALQQLAAAGVGTITIIDDDTVDITNIHRQILFGVDDVGRSKVEVAAERASQLQPGITINALHQRLTTDNAVELLQDVDVVVDGSDSFATKYLVADACEITSTALVWGTVLRFHGDIALWHSGAKASEGRGVGLRDLFPVPPQAGDVPDCASAGVLGVTTSVVAGLMVTRAIAWISGMDRTIGQVTSYDALEANFASYSVEADPQRELTTELLPDYLEVCGISRAPDTAVTALLNKVRTGEATLVDIREPHEVLIDSMPRDYNVHYLPMSTIGSTDDVRRHWSELGDKPAVIMCASGVRSAEFVDRYRNVAPLLDLPGGIKAALHVVNAARTGGHRGKPHTAPTTERHH